MSSRKFEIELRPERSVRLVLAIGAALCSVAGTTLLLWLPLALSWRVALAAGWLAFSVAELWLWCRGAAGICALRIAPGGGVVCIAPDGRRRSAVLASGSVVRERTAWLRVRFANGRLHGDLYRGRRQVAAWRRLHVIRLLLD